MLLQILTYTHHLTTMLFGIFLSAFFLGVKQNKKNVCILLGGGQLRFFQIKLVRDVRFGFHKACPFRAGNAHPGRCFAGQEGKTKNRSCPKTRSCIGTRADNAPAVPPNLGRNDPAHS